jgi:hypothetical protein
MKYNESVLSDAGTSRKPLTSIIQIKFKITRAQSFIVNYGNFQTSNYFDKIGKIHFVNIVKNDFRSTNFKKAGLFKEGLL